MNHLLVEQNNKKNKQQHQPWPPQNGEHSLPLATMSFFTLASGKNLICSTAITSIQHCWSHHSLIWIGKSCLNLMPGLKDRRMSCRCMCGAACGCISVCASDSLVNENNEWWYSIWWPFIIYSENLSLNWFFSSLDRPIIRPPPPPVSLCISFGWMDVWNERVKKQTFQNNRYFSILWQRRKCESIYLTNSKMI